MTFPVLACCLVIFVNSCFGQYIHEGYSYRNGRDYQYYDDYEEESDKSGSSGGDGGGIGALSPLAALIAPLAALALLGAASLVSLNPALLQIAVISGRKRRRRKRWADNESDYEYQQNNEDQLYAEMDLFENFFAKQPHDTIRNQTQELFANYIECSGLSGGKPSDQCLEYLVCLYANPHANIPFYNKPIAEAEKDVISIILYNLLSNKFIDEHVKSRVRVAARQSRNVIDYGKAHAGAWCSVYKCHLIEPLIQTASEVSHRSHRYYPM